MIGVGIGVKIEGNVYLDGGRSNSECKDISMSKSGDKDRSRSKSGDRGGMEVDVEVEIKIVEKLQVGMEVGQR